MRLMVAGALVKYLRFEIELQRGQLSDSSMSSYSFNGAGSVPIDTCGLNFCRLLQESGLYANEGLDSNSLMYLTVMGDTGFALTGVRLYLERRLRRLAQLKHTGRTARGIDDLIGSLQYVKALTSNQAGAILTLNTALNKAVHGASIADEARMRLWIVDCSPRLLAKIDDLIAKEMRMSA